MTDHFTQRVLSLHHKGHSNTDIARMLSTASRKVSVGSVSKALRKGLEKPDNSREVAEFSMVAGLSETMEAFGLTYGQVVAARRKHGLES